jgi:ribosomal protein L37AE/L43A
MKYNKNLLLLSALCSALLLRGADDNSLSNGFTYPGEIAPTAPLSFLESPTKSSQKRPSRSRSSKAHVCHHCQEAFENCKKLKTHKVKQNHFDKKTSASTAGKSANIKKTNLAFLSALSPILPQPGILAGSSVEPDGLTQPRIAAILEKLSEQPLPQAGVTIPALVSAWVDEKLPAQESLQSQTMQSVSSSSPSEIPAVDKEEPEISPTMVNSYVCHTCEYSTTKRIFYQAHIYSQQHSENVNRYTLQ